MITQGKLQEEMKRYEEYVKNEAEIRRNEEMNRGKNPRRLIREHPNKIPVDK